MQGLVIALFILCLLYLVAAILEIVCLFLSVNKPFGARPVKTFSIGHIILIILCLCTLVTSILYLFCGVR